jgi:transposase
MPVRPLSRNETWLLPPTLDELIPQDHAARFVAAFVDALDRAAWAEMDIGLDGEALGAPAYHPRGLLSVWLYGFMTGTRSSRKLEAACRDQMPYLWLTGWQHPDHNTLWRFYREHRGAMRKLFKRTVQTAVKVGLVDLAVQAVDGTKIAGNAAKNRTYDREGLQRLLENGPLYRRQID